eukprot:UN05795
MGTHHQIGITSIIVVYSEGDDCVLLYSFANVEYDQSCNLINIKTILFYILPNLKSTKNGTIQN